MKILHIPTGQACYWRDWEIINIFGLCIGGFINIDAHLEWKIEINKNMYDKLFSYSTIEVFNKFGNIEYMVRSRPNEYKTYKTMSKDEFELID